MAMTTVIGLSAVGAAGCKQKSVPFPEYADDKTMMIGGWDAPINTLEDYRIAKEMGLDFIFLDDLFVKRGTQAYLDVLGYCEEVGLKAVLTVGNAMGVEHAAESWANDLTDYSQYPAVSAINYWDEPNFSNIARIAELTDEHIQKYGDKIDVYANLYPNSATPAFEGHTYSEYVAEYADKVLSKIKSGTKYLSADIYPLEERNGESYLRSNWLNCIETVSKEALRAGAESHFFLQATKHYTYRALTEEDLRWQFYVYMAYGIRSLSYFTYRTSVLDGFSDSFVDAVVSGKKNPQYEWAQKINAEIHAFDHVYLSFQWNGTMPVLGDENEEGYNLNFDGLSEPLEELDAVSDVSAEQDALVGQFRDAAGNDGLLAVNFTDPSAGLRNKLCFTFKNAGKVRVYRMGKPADYQVLNDRFEIELGVGEGAFLIPVP